MTSNESECLLDESKGNDSMELAQQYIFTVIEIVFRGMMLPFLIVEQHTEKNFDRLVMYMTSLCKAQPIKWVQQQFCRLFNSAQEIVVDKELDENYVFRSNCEFGNVLLYGLFSIKTNIGFSFEPNPEKCNIVYTIDLDDYTILKNDGKIKKKKSFFAQSQDPAVMTDEEINSRNDICPSKSFQREFSSSCIKKYSREEAKIRGIPGTNVK